jgi:hypothetical protein
MRKSVLGLTALIAGVCALPVAASAESYICAISEVFECEAVTGCKETTTAAVNLSNFIVLDTDKKTLTGAALNKAAESEDVEGMEITEKHIFLHGHQDEETWNATVSLEDGVLTGGITSQPSSFALFGHCTKK